MRHQNASVEQRIARIANRAHGIVTRAELLGAGITRAAIRHRIGCGALIVEHPSVYRVGHQAPNVYATYMAAVRACGEGALLSGRAAAHLLGLLKGAASPPQVTASKRRRVEGIHTRRSRRLGPRERTVWRGIPVTSPARTLVDLAAELPEAQLARACHEAGIRHRTTPAHVEAVLARWPKSPGAGRLRRVMHGDVKVTLSRLESRFLELLREAGLPLPQTNRPAGSHRVDCRWPEQRLTVELDSYRYHNSRHACEQDRRREREARARGDEFRRYTHHDVFEDSRPMMAELHGLLDPALVGRRLAS